MSNKGTLELIVREFAAAIDPIRDAVEDLDSFESFMLEMGWDIDDLPTDFVNLTNSVETLVTALEALSSSPTLEEVLDLLNKIKDVYQDVKAIGSAPGGTDSLEFLPEFFKRLFEYLVLEYVNLMFPDLYTMLEILGVIKNETYEETATRPSYSREIFNLNQIPELIESPSSFLETVFKWGAEDFDIESLLVLLFELFVSLGFSPRLSRHDPSIEESYGILNGTSTNGYGLLEVPLISFNVNGSDVHMGIKISRFSGDIGFGSGIIIQPYLPNVLTASYDLGEKWEVGFNATTNLFELFGIIITPSKIDVRFPFQNSALLPDAGFGAKLTYTPEEPQLLLGTPNASRMEFTKATLGFDLNYYNFTNLEFATSLDFENFKIVIKGGEGDGFIQKILGDQEQVIESNFGILWSNISGFNFKGGGGGLVVGLVEHIEIGPLSIDQLTLAIRSLTGGTSGFTALVSSNIGLELGPFAGAIEDIGVNLKVKFEEGNAGPFDIGIGFKPPTGIGFSIDASVFKGGGFLSFDFDEERYVGALELTIKDKISLKVIGILTTKLPSNDDGFSLLLLITAEFQPINLGFGFTLNGVGGLIAIHRTMNLNYLRDGVKSNTLDNILFPTDPIANINQIISDLEGAFPIEEGRFAFGPMAIIGWGTPTLITVELGLMIEVPSPVRIAVLGVLKAILPTEEKSLLKLQVNFLGTLDFEAKFITFDASIFASKLLSFTLEGDMAFRLKWGDNSNFLFSIGGFHPSYTPPPLQLPTMKRLTINLLGGNNPRLTLTAYFAVTSNTVQFGSAVDFYYKITNKYSVVGYLGFDILIQFNPFYLTAQIAASLALMKNGNALMSIYLGGSVSGPAPWHVKGKAEIEICGITLKANFDKTFGQPEVTTLPDVLVLPRLLEALSNRSNWQASTPAGSNLLVTLRELDSAPGNVVAHPFGTLGVSQKVVPLDITINKFGTQRPADYKKFELDIADSSGNIFEESALKEYFAPAEFLQMSDSAKLSRKSFEEFNSGVSIKGNNKLKSSYLMDRELMYEQIVMDSRNKPEKLPIMYAEKAVSFRSFIKNGTAAKSRLGSKAKSFSENSPAKVSMKQEAFAIAYTEDLSVYESLTAGSEAEARVLLEELLNSDPKLTDKIQVVPQYQIA